MGSGWELLHFPNRTPQWPTKPTPFSFLGSRLHDCYGIYHFATATFQTWFKPNNKL